MKFAKKSVKKEEPKEVKITPKDQLTFALNKLALFTEKRQNATTPEKLKEMNFWVAHYKKVVEDLEKK